MTEEEKKQLAGEIVALLAEADEILCTTYLGGELDKQAADWSRRFHEFMERIETFPQKSSPE